MAELSSTNAELMTSNSGYNQENKQLLEESNQLRMALRKAEIQIQLLKDADNQKTSEFIAR